MAEIRSCLGLTLVAAALWTTATQAADQAFECRRGPSARQIEVRLAADADRLPCEVVYTKAGKSDVLWSADHELQFCRDKAVDLKDTLEKAGWSCGLARARAGGPGALGTAAQGAKAVGQRGEAAPQRPDTIEEERPETAPQRPDTAPQRAEKADQGRHDGQVTRRAAAPAQRADEETLKAALARDLMRLEQLSSSPAGEFAVEDSKLGDLDRDGVEDAVVLMRYEGADAPGARYLVAYVFDGQTFRPAARARIAGDDIDGAAITRIENGSVQVLLLLHASGGTDVSSSGVRRVTFALRDGALVEVAEPHSGALDPEARAPA
ncbi:MAG: hypothetical protein ACREH6_08300 [Geminicoccaceae bacterium]